MKELLREFQYISNDLKEEKEIAIMKKYGWNAKCYTTILICKVIFWYILYTNIYCICTYIYILI